MPTITLSLTQAGLNTFAAASGQGLNALTFTHIAVGTGYSATGNNTRTSLITETVRQPVRRVGPTGLEDEIRIAVSLTRPQGATGNSNITEIGLFANVTGQAAVLYAYGSDTSSFFVLDASQTDLAFTYARGNIQSLTVTISQPQNLAELDDTPSNYVSGNYLRATGTGYESVKLFATDNQASSRVSTEVAVKPSQVTSAVSDATPSVGGKVQLATTNEVAVNTRQSLVPAKVLTTNNIPAQGYALSAHSHNVQCFQRFLSNPYATNPVTLTIRRGLNVPFSYKLVDTVDGWNSGSSYYVVGKVGVFYFEAQFLGLLHQNAALGLWRTDSAGNNGGWVAFNEEATRDGGSAPVVKVSIVLPVALNDRVSVGLIGGLERINSVFQIQTLNGQRVNELLKFYFLGWRLGT